MNNEIYIEFESERLVFLHINEQVFSVCSSARMVLREAFGRLDGVVHLSREKTSGSHKIVFYRYTYIPEELEALWQGKRVNARYVFVCWHEFYDNDDGEWAPVIEINDFPVTTPWEMDVAMAQYLHKFLGRMPKFREVLYLKLLPREQ